jgi:ACS family hexuronate transporter-like MFS transporter
VEELFPDESALERKQIYANISIVFILSYAFGQAIFGKIFDWIGTRMGFVLSIGVWSLATAAHACAQGIFNSGAAIGGIIVIPLIAYLTVFFSWKMVFVVIGIVGLLWLIPWIVLVKAPPGSHPWITDEEREYILTGQRNTESDVTSDEAEYNPTTGELLARKGSWGVIIASAAIDPIWWLFVFWIPIYLNEVYAMDVKAIGIYGWVPYVGAMFGAWFGGLLAQNRIKAGWNVDKTRKLTITLGCLIMLPHY